MKCVINIHINYFRSFGRYEAHSRYKVCICTLVMYFTVEVCTGPGLALGMRARCGPGSTDNFWVQVRFGSGSNNSKQMLYRTFLGFLRPFLFRKVKVVRSYAHLMHVMPSDSGNKSHQLNLLGSFRLRSFPRKSFG